SKVIIGIVDDGINLINDRFATRNGCDWHSRVDFGWVMDGIAKDVSTVPFGQEYQRVELEAQVRRRSIPERTRLLELGLIDFARSGQQALSRHLSHGTHVADLAAGFDPADCRNDARIIGVQLPTLVTLATSGDFLTPFALAGVGYILDRAYLMCRTLGYAVPVVLNMSYGISGGPHNGGSVLECGIQQLLDAHIKRMCNAFPDEKDACTANLALPMGNQFLARSHGYVRSKNDAETLELKLPWRMQPSDLTANFLEVWMPQDASDVEVSVETADGECSHLPDLGIDAAMVLHRIDSTDPNDVVVQVVMDEQGKALCGASALKRVLFLVAPTQIPFPKQRLTASSGIWTVTVRAKLPKAGQKIEAWIQRDDAPVGYRRPGRPSYFDDPLYQRFTGPDGQGDVNLEDTGPSVVKRYGAMNGIATLESEGCRDRNSVIVGGYMDEPADHAALYAGASDEARKDQSHLRRPDSSAQSDTSRVLLGVLASGTRSGSNTILNGTSVAAPQIARDLVLEKLNLPQPDRVPVPAKRALQLGQDALVVPTWHGGTRRNPS
ncbi:MAG: hypothetical protein AAFV38_02495, partial [Pseudomonadota bacterium]